MTYISEYLSPQPAYYSEILETSNILKRPWYTIIVLDTLKIAEFFSSFSAWFLKTSFEQPYKALSALYSLLQYCTTSTAFNSIWKPSSTLDSLQPPSTTFDRLWPPLKTFVNFDSLRQTSTAFDSFWKPSSFLDSLRPPFWKPLKAFVNFGQPSTTFERLRQPMKTFVNFGQPWTAFNSLCSLQQPLKAFDCIQ